MDVNKAKLVELSERVAALLPGLKTRKADLLWLGYRGAEDSPDREWRAQTCSFSSYTMLMGLGALDLMSDLAAPFASQQFHPRLLELIRRGRNVMSTALQPMRVDHVVTELHAIQNEGIEFGIYTFFFLREELSAVGSCTPRGNMEILHYLLLSYWALIYPEDREMVLPLVPAEFKSGLTY